MTQALVVQNIEDVQCRDYAAGQVVDFPADILAWLKTRKLVDDTASVVAAAISGGAQQITHSAGSVGDRSQIQSISNGVVIDGDSFGANGIFTDATHSQYQQIGWWVWVQALTGWRYNVLAVSAVGGYTVQQSLARFDQYVAPYRPSEVWAILGQNNLPDADGGVAAIAAIREYAGKCKAIGAKLRLGTVTPRYGSFHTSATQAGHIAINRALAAMAREGLFKLFDSSGAVTDPASLTGAILAGYTYDEAITGIHLGPKACHRVARAFARDMDGDLLPPAYPRALSTQDCRQVRATSNQLYRNPKLYDTGTTTGGIEGTLSGGATGASPDYCNLALSVNGGGSTAVVGTTNVADTLDSGRVWFQMTLSGTVAANQTDQAYLIQSQFFSNMLAPVGPGNVVDYCRVSIKSSGLSANIKGIELTVEALDSVSGLLFTGASMAYQGYSAGEWPTDEIVLQTPSFTIPAGAVRLRTTIKAYLGPGACSGSIYVTDVDLSIK